MDREEALRKASRANIQLLIGAGALFLASLNTFKVVQYLQGVISRGSILSVSEQEPEETKKALDQMVETYYESVN